MWQRNNRVFVDQRDAEIERLKRERDELRTRERIARAEAEEAQERLAYLSSASKRFASSIRGRAGERGRFQRRLTAQYAVSRVLAETDNFEEASPKILRILGEGLGCELGVSWTVDEEAGVLRCGEVWYPSGTPPKGFEAACRRTSFRRGVGLPGRVWAKDKALWAENVPGDEDPLLAETVAGEGSRGAFAFPIRDGNILAVFEFFGREGTLLDEELLQTTALVGSQIGQFVRRRQAEEALRESEKLYRLIAENSTDMISKHTPDGVYTYASPACRSLLGYEPEELVGRSAYEFFNPEDLEVIRETHSAILKLPDTYTVAYRIRRKDGSYIWFETTSRTVRDPKTDAVREIIAVSRDVTERKRAEEERERSLARELQIRAQAEERRRISRELHDRVAHSMGVVHQSLQLYEALKERDPSQAEAEMKLAKEMAREALDFTRNLSRKLRDPEVEDSLSAALSNFLRVSVPAGIEHDVSIEGEESLVPLHVREQLFLILREGIRNAVSHSGCGRIAVRIEANSNRIVGCVEDDGRGFAEGDRSAGNGIRSMRERAEFLGGTFELFSTLDAGTKIKASIPLKEAPVGKTKPNDGTADEGR